jgi:uncharacterized protein YndB with AHSA1/START domain
MQLKFQVHTKIQKPLAEVFDAVYNPTKLSAYFATGGASAPLNEGATVIWRFADYPGDAPVTVKKLILNQLIVFEWDAYEPPDKSGADKVEDKPENKLPPSTGYKTTVEMTFESLGPANTLVRITESGWRETQRGLDGSYGNCMGWTQMLCALKAWLEHSINLREGAF